MQPNSPHLSEVRVKPVYPSMAVATKERGFSLLEVAVVLMITGLLSFSLVMSAGNTMGDRDRYRARQIGESLREAVRAFALANARLPCPDTSGSGWEGNADGVCGVSDQAGWFPYKTMGLDLPDARFLAAYSVYRRSSEIAEKDADLVVNKDRTGNSASAPNYQSTANLIVAINNARGDALSQDRTRLTGNDGSEGVVDCQLNIQSHPAFFVVLPLSSRGDAKSLFEEPNGVGHSCAWASDTSATRTRDDVVIAEPLLALGGWLAIRAP